jgi:SAM-dependent methyltransferase
MTSCLFDASYFQTNYPDYSAQNPARKMRFYANVIERYLVSGTPRRVCDLGCAFGRFLGWLDTEWQIFGIDISGFAVAEAARNNPRGVFKVASADAATIFGETFGVVTAFDVLEHVPDLEAVAKSVKQVLVDSGLFVFVVPVYDGLSGPVIRRLDRDPTHIRKWPRSQWIDWAGSHFSVMAWTGILRYLLPGGYYLHMVTRVLREHTPAIIAVCRKC